MKIEYTGRQFTITDKLRQQATSAFEQIAKMVSESASAHVILSVDKYRQIAEVTMATRTQEYVATCESDQMETALHDALAKIEQQVIRYKAKRVTVKRHPHLDSTDEVVTDAADKPVESWDSGTATR